MVWKRSEIAKLIAEASGLHLTWDAPDEKIYPARTVKRRDSVIEVLSKLAAQVDAVIVWNGGNSYSVKVPERD
jgi:hypothetical protein